MKRLTWGLAVFVLLLGGIGQAHAEMLLGEQVRLRIPEGAPPFDMIATVIHPGIEFAPYGQLSFDITADNTLVFTTLQSAQWINFNAAITIVSPGFEFTGIEAITKEPFPFSFAFDSASNAIVVRSTGGFAAVGTTMTGAFTFNSPAVIPEPSTISLLSVSAIGLLGYGWRNRRSVRRGRVEPEV